MKLLDTRNLSPNAIQLLDEGVPGLPQAGDIWMLSWNGTDLGLILLGYVQETYVSALPVTLDASKACASACVVPADASPLGTELVVWAPAPNSIGMHLLSRRIGALCTDREVQRMVHAANGEDIDPLFPLAVKELDVELLADVEFIFNSFASFADHQWIASDAGNAFFDTQTLTSIEWDARRLAETLHVPTSIAAPLFHGEKIPLPEQVMAVAALTGLDEQDLLMPLHVREAVVLSQPELKTAILDLARQRKLDEGGARNLALQDSYALAARQSIDSKMDAARHRVIDSIDRLLNRK